MKTAQLVLGGEDVIQTRAGQVIAGLCLQMDGVAFPESAWSDFAVIVATWWAQAAGQMLRSRSRQVEVRFMDGPYLVQLEPRAGDAWRLRCIEQGLTCRLEATIASGPLVESILSCGQRLLKICRTQGCWTEEAEELQEAIAALDRVAASVQN